MTELSLIRDVVKLMDRYRIGRLKSLINGEIDDDSPPGLTRDDEARAIIALVARTKGQRDD